MKVLQLAVDDEVLVTARYDASMEDFSKKYHPIRAQRGEIQSTVTPPTAMMTVAMDGNVLMGWKVGDRVEVRLVKKGE